MENDLMNMKKIKCDLRSIHDVKMVAKAEMGAPKRFFSECCLQTQGTMEKILLGFKRQPIAVL